MTNREMVIAEDFLNLLTDDIDVAFDNYNRYNHNHDESFDIDTLNDLIEKWWNLVSQKNGVISLLKKLGYHVEGKREKVKIITLRK